MIPEELWKSATRKSLMVGGGLGLLGGLLSGGVGAFSGVCCLFQFATAFMPALLGLVAGGIAGATANWAEFPAGGAAATGAKLGVRGGGVAAFLGGTIGFFCSLLIPICMSIFTAVTNDQDLGMTLATAGAGLAMSSVISLVSSVAGTFFGVLLGAGGGAVAGMVFGKK